MKKVNSVVLSALKQETIIDLIDLLNQLTLDDIEGGDDVDFVLGRAYIIRELCRFSTEKCVVEKHLKNTEAFVIEYLTNAAL